MYVVTYKCLICHETVIKDFPNSEIWDVEFEVNDNELQIASGKIFCPACGQKSAISVAIYDDVSAEVVFEKIISPFNYGNSEVWDKGKLTKHTECDLCNGDGTIGIAKETHLKDDMVFIDYGDCPLCMGKGYLEEEL